jgi:MFS family permease
LAAPRGGIFTVRVRLSLLMFLIYAAPGAIVPLFSLRLKELGFTPVQIGVCCMTQALGTTLAPLLAGQLADRWFSAERCLVVCAAVEAVLLWVLGGLTEPNVVFAVSLVFWLVMAPAMTLTTYVAFAHLKNPGRDYGRVRLWGTVGWVLPLWFMGVWLSDAEWLRSFRSHAEMKDAFRLASVLAVAFGLYCLTIPRTLPRKSTLGWLAPLVAFRQFRGRAFYIYAFCTFGVSLVLPFSTQVTPLLLSSKGIARAWLMPTLTIAQGSEVLTLALLPLALGRLGVRRTMQIGLVATVLTLGSLMAGTPLGLVIAGYGCYGMCIAFYLVAGQMYLNRRANEGIRASAQAMHSVICGLGQLVGNPLVGLVRREFNEAFAPTFAVAAGIALVLFVVFVFGFPRVPAKRVTTVSGHDRE